MDNLNLNEIKDIKLNKLMFIDVKTDFFQQVDYNSCSHYPILILTDKKNNIGLPNNDKLTNLVSNLLNKSLKKMTGGYNSHMSNNIDVETYKYKLSSFTGINDLSQLIRGLDLYGMNTSFDMPKEHYNFLGLLKYNVNTNEFKYSYTDNRQIVYSIIEHLLKVYHFNESLKDIQNKDVRNIYNKISKLNQTDKNELYKLLSVKEYH